MRSDRTIHFVYATPLTFLDKVTMLLYKRKVQHPPWDQYEWPVPLRAPLSITYQVARFFSARCRLRLYDLQERITIEPRKGDILLGHAWPDPESAVWRALEDNRFSRKYLISPYNHDPKQVQWMYRAIEQCDSFFAVCGQYWLDTFERSPFSGLREKVIRLNMGIDTADYPLVKTSFNPPGKRKFFYVGRTGQEKGIDLLERLATEMDGFQGGYICQGGGIKGWEKISEPTDLTPEFMMKIAGEYDVFINMSRADAQATTVLEAMSWGFPVACTPETGYTEEKLFFLDLENEHKNIETINRIQRMSDGELREISINNRKIVELAYSWERFLSTIEKNITE
jgi:glycosyltransferase involved in cell wall biosynthesis